MFPLMSPDAPVGTGVVAPITPTSDNKEDVIEFLGEDDKPEVIPLEDKDKDKDKSKDKKDEKKEDDKKGKDKDVDKEDIDEEKDDDEEDDELTEIEEELKGPTDEQLELVTPVRRKEILKKYPALFKDFPYLEKAYYREQQFTELLPTIQDAKEAKEKAETLDKFDNDIMQGNTEVVLKVIKEQYPRAFNKVVDDYMTTLARVDEKAHTHVIGNTIKHTIVSMVEEGRRSNNEALLSAAQILNQYVFGSSDFVPPKKLSVDTTTDDKKDTELQTRERQFVQRQFDTARTDLNSRVNNTLKNTIAANIDPKSSMTDYVKRNAIREATETLEGLIEKDTRFKVLVDKLWEAAFKDNFSKTSVDRIKSAFTSKAKTLLPSVIKKARNEALRGIGRKVSADEVDEKPDKKGPIKEGVPSSRSGGKVKDAADIPKGMSTLEFLNSD